MDVELLLGLIHNIEDHRTHSLDCLDSSNESSLCIPVVDALAQILVRTAGEVVAVGVQLSQEKVIVTCSTNEEVMPVYIHQRLTTIWTFLQQISDGYRLYQNGHAPLCVPATEKLLPETQDIIYNFLFVVNEYSSEKSLSRVNKHFGDLKQIVNSLEPNQELTAQLSTVCEIIEVISQDLTSDHTFSSVTDDFKDLCGCFDCLFFTVHAVLDNSSAELERTADAINMFSLYHPYFPLRQYLKKLASLPIAVTTLLSFACSPCLRSRFLADKTLGIRYASVGRPRISEYPKPEQWNEVSRAALESQNESPHPNNPRPYPPFSNKDLNCPLHCEIALALHYLSRHPVDPPALSCIGVSKLSCFACWSFLECIQGIGVNFSTRGTHEKTYFPWRYPGEELGVSNYAYHAASIHDNLYSILAERYATCVRSRRVVTGLGFETNEDPDAYWYAWVAVERKRKEHAELELGVDDAGRHRKRLKKTGEVN